MPREHKDIEDPNIHEPKGTASASEDEVIVADGLGASSYKRGYSSGVYNYNDSGAGGSISLTPVNTFVKMINDGAGGNTILDYALPTIPTIYDGVNSQFDFSSLELGDVVLIRVDLNVTTTTNNTELNMQADLGIGGTPFSLNIGRLFVKSTGTYSNRTFFSSVFMGSANTKNNPAEISVSSDAGSASVVVNGWSATVIKRGVMYV